MYGCEAVYEYFASTGVRLALELRAPPVCGIDGCEGAYGCEAVHGCWLSCNGLREIHNSHALNRD